MIQKKNLYFPTLADFLAKKISANRANTAYITGSLDATAQTGEPDVMYQSVAYIRDTRQIWTYGMLFGGGSTQGLSTETAERIAADDRLNSRIAAAIGRIDALSARADSADGTISDLADELEAEKESIMRSQVAVFRSIESTGTLIQQSSSDESTPEDVRYFADAGVFGFVSGTSGQLVTAPQYYANWPNRPIYADGQLHPYADKLYFCIDDRKLYCWDGSALTPLTADGPTLIHFDLNPATGHLTLTKADPGDRFSAEVADGRLLLTITE